MRIVGMAGSGAVILLLFVHFMPAAWPDTPREAARRWVEQGLALDDNSEAEAACYRMAIDLDPTYAAAHFNLGYVLQARGAHADALSAYRLCIEHDPDRVDAFLNAGRLTWLAWRDAEEARRLLNRYVELQRGASRVLDNDGRDAEDTIQRLEEIIAEQKGCHVQDFYTAEEIVRILARRITRERGGGNLYSAGRVPLVLFSMRSAVLGRAARQQLDEVVRALRDPRVADFAIVIEGHTDWHGDSIANRALSDRRAERVLRYLSETGGIPSERFEVRAYGEDRPVAPNASRDERRMNNRLEINHAAACW